MEIESSESRQRVLDAAERLFMEHGYGAVTLRDIAQSLGIRQASLYYHFPEGKEQLYVAVVERLMTRHQAGLEEVIQQAGPDLAAQLEAVTHWFGGQPPIHFLGMMHADLPALSPEARALVARLAYQALFMPLRTAFTAAQERGEARPLDPDLLAGFFVSLLDGITFSLSQQQRLSRPVMSQAMLSLFLDGLRPRPEPGEPRSWTPQEPGTGDQT